MANEASSKQPAIPGYEPIRVLGMNLGTVYLARHSSSGALVALKVLPLDLAGHVRDLYLPLARLHHPNIMRVVEMGEFEEKFFCAMEYVERSLADRVLEGPLSSAEAAQLAHVVCSALQYASDQGVVALSLAPRSIFLTDESVPKIAEFCSRESNGEPRFLEWALTPPECVSSSVGSASEASQVYRVGALMYEMLTAQPPLSRQIIPQRCYIRCSILCRSHCGRLTQRWHATSKRCARTVWRSRRRLATLHYGSWPITWSSLCRVAMNPAEVAPQTGRR